MNDARVRLLVKELAKDKAAGLTGRSLNAEPIARGYGYGELWERVMQNGADKNL